jgi:ribosome modulation factor
MTHAQIYQNGIKAYIDGRSLGDNPYDQSANWEAYEAWTEGWREASRARCRIHALEIAAHPHVKPSMRAANLSAQGV